MKTLLSIQDGDAQRFFSAIDVKSIKVQRALIEIAKGQSHWDLRVRCIDTLGIISGGEQFFFEELAALLKSENSFVKDSAMKALKRIVIRLVSSSPLQTYNNSAFSEKLQVRLMS